jgi:hypothetical protein
MRYCEQCGVSGMHIEVREIWIDGEYFGTFCGRCEMRRGTGTPSPARRRANSRCEDGGQGSIPNDPRTSPR